MMVKSCLLNERTTILLNSPQKKIPNYETSEMKWNEQQTFVGIAQLHCYWHLNFFPTCKLQCTKLSITRLNLTLFSVELKQSIYFIRKSFFVRRFSKSIQEGNYRYFCSTIAYFCSFCLNVYWIWWFAQDTSWLSNQLSHFILFSIKNSQFGFRIFNHVEAKAKVKAKVKCNSESNAIQWTDYTYEFSGKKTFLFHFFHF